MPHKTHKTAVVLIPPVAVWPPIQTIRRQHDRQVRRWMPHMTLLYPFRPVRELGDAAQRLAEVCRRHVPFEIVLSEFDTFRHRGEQYTLWLNPEPAQPIRRLQADLQRVYPDCDDVARFPNGFQPHLSVGQSRGPAATRELVEALTAEWQRLAFMVEAVHLIAREDSPDDVFEVVYSLTLGSGEITASHGQYDDPKTSH